MNFPHWIVIVILSISLLVQACIKKDDSAIIVRYIDLMQTNKTQVEIIQLQQMIIQAQEQVIEKQKQQLSHFNVNDKFL